jgi:cytochrome c peroxidase
MTLLRNLVIGFITLFPLLCASSPVGYGKLTYQLPDPGSYALPSLGPAADGEVLTGDGESVRLHSTFDKEFTVLAFIYSSCNDEDGCPLSSYVLYQLKDEIEKNQELEKKLKLVSLSFDPRFDTPEMIKLYENGFKKKGEVKNYWEFLTTKNETTLDPILKAYGQDVQRINSSDKKVSVFSHILRVYLIDKEKRIRNIYNVDFLHKDMILNDVKNLIALGKSDIRLALKAASYLEPGDYRSGYENDSFETQSKSVEQRVGDQIDLMKHAEKKHLGYPTLDVPN